jgi:glucokinase
MIRVPTPTGIAVPVMEIGGTHVTGALIDPATMQVIDGTVVRRSFDDLGSAEDILATIAATANSIPTNGDWPGDLSGNGSGFGSGGFGSGGSGLGGFGIIGTELDGRSWGIAIPAPFDYSSGIAWFEGVGKFDALRGIDIGDRLKELIVPTPETFRFVNDADAFVLGEWIGGALVGTHRCAGLTLGSGVGSGFVVDGAVVWDGPGVPPEGSVHHLLIDGRPLEETVSRRAIRSAYAAISGDTDADVKDIADRAGSGSSDAIRVLAHALRSLGCAVGPYLAEFGPELVVIGGAMSASWPLFEPAFAQGCGDVGVAVPAIVVTNSGESAGLRGAAYELMRSVKRGL